jgi:hypothetical protein
MYLQYIWGLTICEVTKKLMYQVVKCIVGMFNITFLTRTVFVFCIGQKMNGLCIINSNPSELLVAKWNIDDFQPQR